MYRFAAASETEDIVFGAARPGYRDLQVLNWIEFMQNQNIDRVCCLLAPHQLSKYSNLLGTYRQKFGKEKVCWTPIEDFHFVDYNALIEEILPFLIAAEKKQERVVVHCSGRIGRTEQILTAWLVTNRKLSNKEAISVIKSTGRNPHEAVIINAISTGGSPWQVINSFNILLNDCRDAVKTISHTL